MRRPRPGRLMFTMPDAGSSPRGRQGQRPGHRVRSLRYSDRGMRGLYLWRIWRRGDGRALPSVRLPKSSRPTQRWPAGILPSVSVDPRVGADRRLVTLSANDRRWRRYRSSPYKPLMQRQGQRAARFPAPSKATHALPSCGRRPESSAWRFVKIQRKAAPMERWSASDG